MKFQVLTPLRWLVRVTAGGVLAGGEVFGGVGDGDAVFAGLAGGLAECFGDGVMRAEWVTSGTGRSTCGDAATVPIAAGAAAWCVLATA